MEVRAACTFLSPAGLSRGLRRHGRRPAAWRSPRQDPHRSGPSPMTTRDARARKLERGFGMVGPNRQGRSRFDVGLGPRNSCRTRRDGLNDDDVIEAGPRRHAGFQASAPHGRDGGSTVARAEWEPIGNSDSPSSRRLAPLVHRFVSARKNGGRGWDRTSDPYDVNEEAES
jgi:hypothetical protein